MTDSTEGFRFFSPSLSVPLSYCWATFSSFRFSLGSIFFKERIDDVNTNSPF